jgi:hypothetical protein
MRIIGFQKRPENRLFPDKKFFGSGESGIETEFTKLCRIERRDAKG